jgi:hypothetical protein
VFERVVSMSSSMSSSISSSSVVTLKVSDIPLIVNVLETVSSYSVLEISSILTVHPFCIYQVVPTKLPLIYNAQLFTLASTGISELIPAIVILFDVYVLLVNAPVISVKLKLLGIVSVTQLYSKYCIVVDSVFPNLSIGATYR